jgi:hypothetical protein
MPGGRQVIGGEEINLALAEMQTGFGGSLETRLVFSGEQQAILDDINEGPGRFV